MSLLDRLTPSSTETASQVEPGLAESTSLGDRIGARALTEQAEPVASGSTPDRPLLEDLIAARPLRFFSPRDIQYAVEDLATAAERFQDRDARYAISYKMGSRRKDACEDEKKAKDMLESALKELRSATSALKKYADFCESD